MVRMKTETDHLCKRGDRVHDSIWNKYLAITNKNIMVRLKTDTEHFCKKGDIVQDILRNKSSV